jgi:glyceraldehyde-3-phosphate dehydrogenase/erythrose-4-phosphate dehydrogenase
MSRPAVGIGGAGRIGRLTLRCAVIADTVRGMNADVTTEKKKKKKKKLNFLFLFFFFFFFFQIA